MAAIPESRDLNTVTADEWRAASTYERDAFTDGQRRRGCVSMVCLTCGFPTVYGQASCDACRDIDAAGLSAYLLQSHRELGEEMGRRAWIRPAAAPVRVVSLWETA